MSIEPWMDTEPDRLGSPEPDAAAHAPSAGSAAAAPGAGVPAGAPNRLLPTVRPVSPAPSPLLAATDLQDHLLVAANDLDRLQRLLADASTALVTHFHGAAGQMKLMLKDAARRQDIETTPLNEAMNHLAAAITSLQFQDMASQLLAHTHRRLRGCADRLAAEAMAADDDEAFVDTVPMNPNPVTQDEMDAGSVELF